MALSLAGRASLPMPGSPVPVSLQSLALALALVAAGPRVALGGVVLWLGGALAGLPLLANGRGGLEPFSGPGYGFLLGFALAPLVDLGLEGRPAWLRVSVAHLVLLAAGGLGMMSLGATAATAWGKGVAPFLPGGVAKILLASALAPWVRPRRPTDS